MPSEICAPAREAGCAANAVTAPCAPLPCLAGFNFPLALAAGDGRPRIPETLSVSPDPGARFVLQLRDLRLLGVPAWLREVPGDQLHTAIFGGKEPAFSRRLGKLRDAKLFHVDRVLGSGFNRVRLTNRGRDLLVEHGVMAEADVWVPRAFLPLKDMTHGHLVAGTALLLDAKLPFRWDAIFPSWTTQRRVTPTPVVIPDLLAIRATPARPPGRVWAIEIDLGGERLKGTLLPKLALLARDLTSWANGGEARIVVLTRGTKRLQALRTAVAAASLPVPVAADLLPRETGRAGIEALRRLISPPAKPTSQSHGAQHEPSQ